MIHGILQSAPLHDQIHIMQDTLDALVRSRNSVADEVLRVASYTSQVETIMNDFKSEQLKENALLWKEIRQLQKCMELKGNKDAIETSLNHKVDIHKLNDLMEKEIRPVLFKKADVQ